MQAAFACAPGLLLLLAVVGGRPGITYDSVYYLAAADSLSATGRLGTPIATHAAVQFAADGTLISEHPFVTWPPGFPVALGFVRALGLDIELAAPLSRAALQATHAGALVLSSDVPRLTWQTRRPTYRLPSLDVLRRFAASNEFVVLLADESAAEPDVIAWLNATAAHQGTGDGYRLWWMRGLSTATPKP